jgi:hypothetical protein
LVLLAFDRYRGMDDEAIHSRVVLPFGAACNGLGDLCLCFNVNHESEREC